MATATSPVCACPPAWEAMKQAFNAGVGRNSGPPHYVAETWRVCSGAKQGHLDRLRTMVDSVSSGHREEIAGLAGLLWQEGRCLAGLAVLCYSCLVYAYQTGNYAISKPLANYAVRIFAWSAGCFEPGASSGWQVTTGQMWRHLAAVSLGSDLVFGSMGPLHTCADDAAFEGAWDSLVGYCGEKRHILPALVGPLDPILEDDVVLCTHTTIDLLTLVEPALTSWRGPSSVAILAAEPAQARPVLLEWSRRLRRLGLRRVVVSLVGPSEVTCRDYDTIYPANVLRQVAMDAAVADLVLLVDPGFVPSAGFRGLVGASAPLGAALRRILAAAPTAFLVTSFLTFGASAGASAGNGTQTISFQDVRRLVDAGDAIAFEWHVCPVCRPYAWQTMLLEGPSSLRFREVEQHDLYHPFWLTSRSVLPRLPTFMHGLVEPHSFTDVYGLQRLGRWTGLPNGLRASAEQLRAVGARLLLLPGAFLHRSQQTRMPGGHWEDLPLGLIHNFWDHYFDVLFYKFVNSLPLATSARNPARGAPLPQSFLVRGQPLSEILPPRSTSLTTLQIGSDPSLQVVVIATQILGSEGLDRLLSSVPWTVHAVCVGVKNFWSCALDELPAVLRSFPSDALVGIFDAYDIVLFPCSRSIANEYRSLGKELIYCASMECHPTPSACRSCEQRYGHDEAKLNSCRAAPYLNSGCVIGSPDALADAMDWIRDQGPAVVGKDDQEQQWHLYNRFPDRVGLDHHQRLFSVLHYQRLSDFRVENCTVVNDRIGGEVCLAHADGPSKWEILQPLLQQLEEQGCREPLRRGRGGSRVYPGLSPPKSVWWDPLRAR